MNDVAKIVEEIYKRFRTSTIALSVTLIALSGASINAVRASLSLPHGLKTALMLPFSIVIVLGLMMQYLHFYGYSPNARALVDQLQCQKEMR